MFSKIGTLIVPDIGIDLGSTTSRVCMKSRDAILEVPSALAVNTSADRVIEVGEKAKRYLGRRVGNVMVVSPLKHGRVVDVEIAAAFIRFCLEKVLPRRWWRKFIKPRITVVVRRDATGVEKCAIEVAGQKAGAGDVRFVEAPMAAAIGTGLPVTERSGCMIVEIGGSSCCAAVVSEAGIVADRVCPGGDVFDLCIFEHLRTTYNMEIDAATAESVKKTIGSACHVEPERDMEVEGKDISSDRSRTVMVTSEEIRKVLAGQVSLIVKSVCEVIREAGPKYAKGIRNRGIVLSGGGSLLRGLDEMLAKETGFDVVRVDNPESSSIKGVGAMIGNTCWGVNELGKRWQ